MGIQKMKALSLREITANLNTREETKQVVRKGDCRKWLLECSKIGFQSYFRIFGFRFRIADFHVNTFIYLCKSEYFCQFFCPNDRLHLLGIFRFFRIFPKKCLFGRLEQFGGFGILGNNSSDPSANFFFWHEEKKKNCGETPTH